MKRIKHFAILTALTFVALAAGGALFVYGGVYNISALDQHTYPVYRLLQFAMERSVAMRSYAETPEMQNIDWEVAGVLHYENHCRRCHGAPGRAPEGFALGLVPAPTAIAELARKRNAQAIFWVVKHGVKMTGMPAWEFRLSEAEMWQVVALVMQIPNMTSGDYTALLDEARSNRDSVGSYSPFAPTNNGQLIEQGRIALQQYACVSCHIIPGITAGRNYVGPPLGGITQRAYIAGVLEYSDENLIKWLRFPDQIDPNTTMPNLGVTEPHARAIMAYLKSIDAQ